MNTNSTVGLFLTAVLIATISSCSDSSPQACVPGRSVSCACAGINAAPGVQVCLTSGTFGSCACAALDSHGTRLDAALGPEFDASSIKQKSPPQSSNALPTTPVAICSFEGRWQLRIIPKPATCGNSTRVRERTLIIVKGKIGLELRGVASDIVAQDLDVDPQSCSLRLVETTQDAAGSGEHFALHLKLTGRNVKGTADIGFINRDWDPPQCKNAYTVQGDVQPLGTADLKISKFDVEKDFLLMLDAAFEQCDSLAESKHRSSNVIVKLTISKFGNITSLKFNGQDQRLAEQCNGRYFYDVSWFKNPTGRNQVVEFETALP